MADKSPIEWTDATWNPTRGCRLKSDGCRNCYAMGVAARFSGPGQPYEGLAEYTSQGPKWTGKVVTVPEALYLPLTWREPRRVFVDSMSDLFIEDVPDQFITDVLGICALTPWHTYQILTKRPERALQYLGQGDHGIIDQFTLMQQNGGISIKQVFQALDRRQREGTPWAWPLPNVQIGVSIEDQPTAHERLPLLAAIPAATHFVSAEPLLARVNLEQALAGSKPPDWLITGGESGAKARPMHPAHARSLRDQCEALRIPFFFKQWGEWCPAEMAPPNRLFAADAIRWATPSGEVIPLNQCANPARIDRVVRLGKKAAGRMLDGRTHDEFPRI